MRLEGKVALITGGGSGMGRAIAVAFAREGAGVQIVDMNRQSAKEVAILIRDTGGEADFHQADVASEEETKQAVAATIRRFGKLHILVNNAGVHDSAKDALVEDLTEETWDWIIGVNLKGPFNFCRHAIPEIVTCGGGSVINIASTAGLTASPSPAYSSSKGALITLTRSVARQFAADNVRVNAICPGPIDTPLSDRARAISANAAIHYPAAPVLLDRRGQPEEVAATALFLASEDASYITAAVYPVDGGFTAG